MHPSANYDYLMHGDHFHWCDVEAKGISQCEELAVREHSAAAATDPLADVGLSLVVAMMITMGAGLIWGVAIRSGGGGIRPRVMRPDSAELGTQGG